MYIKILTFHCAKNFGAVLQAYALRTVLKKYADDVRIINYRPDCIVKNYSKCIDRRAIVPFVKSLAVLGLYVVRKYFCSYGKRIKKFSLFEQDYLAINSEREVFTDKALVSSGNADYVFLGSDQIWNCKITHYDAVYLGDIKKIKSCKLVSYAASIGNDITSKEEEMFLAKYIKNISCVAVREETARDLLSRYRQDIEVVLDPVFLLSQDDWKNIAVYPQESDYVLLYNMGGIDAGTAIANRIADVLHIKVVEIFPGGRSLKKMYCHKIYPGAGPLEFIGLFAKAKYVVTSSFHGTAFAVLFNKQFITIAPGKVSSRVRDFLARLDLNDRVVDSADALPQGYIDYSVVNVRLDAERQKSIDFLEKALGVRD